jgi:hypothetical protein
MTAVLFVCVFGVLVLALTVWVVALVGLFGRWQRR